MGRTAVVTGVGVVSSIGTGVDGFWDALAGGVSGASVLELEGEPPTPVCRIEEFDGEALFGRRDARRMDRCAQLATAAAQLALADAGGDLGLPHERMGASIGSAHGGIGTLDEAYRTFFERGSDRVSPFMIPLVLTNTACAAVARTLQLRGPSCSTCTACAAGADAIGTALWLIRSGRADAMLAGGADAPISPVVLAGYRNLGALASLRHGAEGASRPFDSERDGFVIGEGAGVLVLEEREHALARGARIYAVLGGYGSSCDASHLTDPDQTGAGPGAAMSAALADAGIGPADVGYVSAHATSTPSGDIAEARAIARAGLAHAAVSATKAMHGHTLGGAGGVEAAASLLPLVRGIIPPTLNLREPDDGCGLDHVMGAARRDVDVRASISNSFGFGGHNAALVFLRP
ncbi:MAG: 3-oxoacyl-[acyl-carrier-protein] synthase [Solirubrobacteraceae bacterium]|jgi:3-oxoacyl-[acyl-carrier-protein] synthase II|nr:3-oxoacyl-[acyl-carrier-protein] synthase [Solirubrobacteraceae bacterium]